MKNEDYVLRFEVLSGVSQANKTNSYSSFFIYHSSFNRLFTKELKIMNYELKNNSHPFPQMVAVAILIVDDGVKLFLGNSTDGGKLRVHTDVCKIY